MKNWLIILSSFYCFNILSQPVPAKEENIPFLVTFSEDASLLMVMMTILKHFSLQFPKIIKSHFTSESLILI